MLWGLEIVPVDGLIVLLEGEFLSLWWLDTD